jgi:hypothetical protein
MVSSKLLLETNHLSLVNEDHKVCMTDGKITRLPHCTQKKHGIKPTLMMDAEELMGDNI